MYGTFGGYTRESFGVAGNRAETKNPAGEGGAYTSKNIESISSADITDLHPILSCIGYLIVLE